MLTNILIFIFGFIVGALVLWTYNFVTDKVTIAKAGYGISKTFVMYIINKFRKKTVNKS